MLALETVTVAVYVPGASPVLGATVKVVLPPAATLGREASDSANALAFGPESEKLITPVGTVPVFNTVIVRAACAAYPSTAAGKVYVPVSLSVVLIMLTVKLTSNDCDALPLDAVTVAVYVPGTRPVLGATVKVVLPPTAILGREASDSVNEPAFGPESEKLTVPVGDVPVFLTVIVRAVCAP